MLSQEKAKSLFDSLLYIDSDNEDNEYENKTKKTDNICLISNTKLEMNSIKLDCGHCFNYIPLYNEICQQKTRKLLDNARLRLNEIKCPYCRTVTNKLIPFYKFYQIKQVKGVNYPGNLCMDINRCEYTTQKSGKHCNNSACVTKYGNFCNKHFKYYYHDEKIIDSIDDNEYNFYKKKTIMELKKILKDNNYKINGNKHELILRIIIYKTKNNINWIEN